jgi:hypothetical protein
MSQKQLSIVVALALVPDFHVAGEREQHKRIRTNDPAANVGSPH